MNPPVKVIRDAYRLRRARFLKLLCCLGALLAWLLVVAFVVMA
jgi:hypothetical protein